VAEAANRLLRLLTPLLLLLTLLRLRLLRLLTLLRLRLLTLPRLRLLTLLLLRLNRRSSKQAAIAPDALRTDRFRSVRLRLGQLRRSTDWRADTSRTVSDCNDRDAKGSVADRQWIESAYSDYLEDLAHLNTGVFPVFGEFGDREPDLMAAGSPTTNPIR